MADNLQRSAQARTYTLTTAIGTTPAIPFENCAGGLIEVIGNLGTLAWYAADAEGGTYKQVYKADDSAVCNPNTVTQNRSYPFPDEVFGAAWLKIVAVLMLPRRGDQLFQVRPCTAGWTPESIDACAGSVEAWRIVIAFVAEVPRCLSRLCQRRCIERIASGRRPSSLMMST